MALGLGLAIGLFAVVDAVLLRPLPYADQHELVVMWERDDSTDNPHIEVSLPNFEDWPDAGRVVHGHGRDGLDHLGTGGGPGGPAGPADHQRGLRVVLRHARGHRPSSAARFLPEEDGAEAPRVMVLSHAAWRQYFDMDPGVVGTTVPVGVRREPFTVIGVMPPAFQFPPGAEVWTPVGRELAGIFRQNEMDAGAQRGPRGSLRDRPPGAGGRTLEEARGGDGRHRAGAVGVAISQRWGTRRAVVTPLADYIFGNAEAAVLVAFRRRDATAADCRRQRDRTGDRVRSQTRPP